MSASAPIHAWRGATGPFSLWVDPGVFMPSRTSVVLADSLVVAPGDLVVDVGCGSGVLSFVAARLGAARVIGCDASVAATRCAEGNASRLGLGSVTEFRHGDLLEPVHGLRADVVIGDVSGVPDWMAAMTGWFPDGRGGGPTGAELPVALLQQVGDHLRPGGTLYLPTGTIQHEAAVLAAARAVFGEEMHRVAERHFPFPTTVARAAAMERSVADGVIRPRRVGSRLTWRLTIWRCRMAQPHQPRP